MSAFVDRPNRRIPKTPEGVAEYLRQLRQQGITLNEISKRIDVGEEAAREIIVGTRHLSPQRASKIAGQINQYIAKSSFVIRIPGSGGKIVSVEPINQRERDTARGFLDELQNFKKGRKENISQFSGLELMVRGTEGAESFKVVTDKPTLRRMARQGSLIGVRYWRNQGS